MHDIRWIRDNPDAFDRALGGRKNVPVSASGLIALDDARKAAIQALEEALEKRNALSKQIGQAKAQKDEPRAQALMAEVAALKDAIPGLDAARKAAEDALRDVLLTIPNLPAEGVPVGEDEAGNREYFGRNGTATTAAQVRPAKPVFGFAPKEHFETGEKLGMMDFEVAAKLSGARFVVLKSQLARLERALGQFMLDTHVDKHGYTEVQPPLLVRDEAMFGTGQLPKFREDQFAAIKNIEAYEQGEKDQLWLIPTA
jgi:seryl-tRNA synthetase